MNISPRNMLHGEVRHDTMDTMNHADELLQALQGALGDRGQVRHIAHLPAREATFAPWPSWANPDVVRSYRNIGVNEPWRHQITAADALYHGMTTAIATQTGSGKSLGFWLPILSTIVEHKKDRAAQQHSLVQPATPSALYLAPTKALAADQHAKLKSVIASGDLPVVADTCDGDTAREAREWIRARSDIVLTNPDFLHFSMLPQHQRWIRFLRSLRYVVIDEGHAYRGLFGAHVALVLRRLMRLRAHYADSLGDTRLTFVVASATSADPAYLAELLSGSPRDEIVVVDHSDAPVGPRSFVMWQPPLVDDTTPSAAVPQDSDEAGFADLFDNPAEFLELVDDPTGLVDQISASGLIPGQASPSEVRRSATAEAAHISAALVLAGARLLTFTRSRRGAETVATAVKDLLTTRRGYVVDDVAAYRGGYLPEERRALEAAISSGSLRALATTNALELGIDISGLDAVVIAGWPGSRASLWQQAGRAGRAGNAGLVVFVSRQDPLDTFILDHPEAVLLQSVEASVLDPSNRYVLAPHLCAAAAEVPLREHDLELFGDSARELVAELAAGGFLRQRGSTWFWTRPESAASLADLRGAGDGTVSITEADSGQVIGTMGLGDADNALHTGAVYVHRGQVFQVVEYRPDEFTAFVTPRSVDFHTWSRSHNDLRIVSRHDVHEFGDNGIQWCFGEVEVTSQVTEFERIRNKDRLVLGTFPLDLPQRLLHTTAVWWTIPAQMLSTALIDAKAAPGALHALEHAAIGVLPLLATCDRSDIGGLSTVWHEQTEQATIFIHDGAPGGAGLSERAFGQPARWLSATLEVIESCSCRNGCPACVQSPKCGNGNKPLDKDAARRLLQVLLADVV